MKLNVIIFSLLIVSISSLYANHTNLSADSNIERLSPDRAEIFVMNEENALAQTNNHLDVVNNRLESTNLRIFYSGIKSTQQHVNRLERLAVNFQKFGITTFVAGTVSAGYFYSFQDPSLVLPALTVTLALVGSSCIAHQYCRYRIQEYNEIMATLPAQHHE